jgi:hypothetical protein
MDQLDRRIADNIRREMLATAVDPNRLAGLLGMSERTWWHRLEEGGFKMRELGVIANALGCSLHTLIPEEWAA